MAIKKIKFISKDGVTSEVAVGGGLLLQHQ